MAKVLKRYEAAPGATYTDSDAQIIGERLEQIGNGKFKDLTPADVVKDARRRGSPLHKFFTWDDSAAASKWRLWEARHMLSTLRVVVMRGGGETEFKAFHNIHLPQASEDEGVQRVYRPAMSLARSEKEVRQEVIEQAKRELESWRRRYAEYETFFGSLFAKIDELMSEEIAA